jgi:FkbM family methyltransferase
VNILCPSDIAPVRSSLDLTGASEFYIGKMLLEGGMASYEPEVLALLGAYVEAQGPIRFLDIGANIGGFSLITKAIFGDRVDVSAFEPMPAHSTFIRDAARRNGLAIEVSECALSNERGRAQFYVSSKTDTSNSLNRRFRPHKGVIDVEVRTLDDLFPEPLGRPCVMKIDTESTEPDVLAGAKSFVQRERPIVLCEVLAGRTEERLEVWLAETGYVAIQITDAPQWDAVQPLRGDTSYTHRDWLFAPERPSSQVRERFAVWMRALTTR